MLRSAYMLRCLEQRAGCDMLLCRYSGKEMVPQAGGITPHIAKVRLGLSQCYHPHKTCQAQCKVLSAL